MTIKINDPRIHVDIIQNLGCKIICDKYDLVELAQDFLSDKSRKYKAYFSIDDISCHFIHSQLITILTVYNFVEDTERTVENIAEINAFFNNIIEKAQ